MTKIHFGCFREIENLWKNMDIFGEQVKQVGYQAMQENYSQNGNSSQVLWGQQGCCWPVQDPEANPQTSAAGISTPGGEVYFSVTRGRRLSTILDPLHLRDVLQVQERQTWLARATSCAMVDPSRACPHPVLLSGRDVRLYIVLSPCS